MSSELSKNLISLPVFSPPLLVQWPVRLRFKQATERKHHRPKIRYTHTHWDDNIQRLDLAFRMIFMKTYCAYLKNYVNRIKNSALTSLPASLPIKSKGCNRILIALLNTLSILSKNLSRSVHFLTTPLLYSDSCPASGISCRRSSTWLASICYCGLASTEATTALHVTLHWGSCPRKTGN